MYVQYDPDEYKTVSEYHTCPFHEMHPGEQFAGCTCSWIVSTVRRSPEEYARIKAKRFRDEEDRILAQAEIIKSRRARDAEAE